MKLYGALSVLMIISMVTAIDLKKKLHLGFENEAKKLTKVARLRRGCGDNNLPRLFCKSDADCVVPGFRCLTLFCVRPPGK